MTVRRPLHVGYLVQQFPPEIGAGPARVTELARRWIALGARVTVATGMPSGKLPGQLHGTAHPAYQGKVFLEEDWHGIRVLRSWVYRNGGGGLAGTLVNNTSFMVTSAAYALARLGKVDVLIASAPPFFPHLAGALVARLRGIPLVLEIRDLWPDYLVGMGVLKPGRGSTRALFALERRLLRQARHVVVVTDSFRRRVVEKGVAPERVSVLPNGVDPAAYYPEEVDTPPLPELTPSGPDGFTVGYLGTFGASQNLESVIDAAALLAAEDPSIRVVLVGDGPQRQRVVAHAAARALPNLSIHGTLPRERTRAFYNACDACLVPLTPIAVFQETIPSKIFEVMACERPVVACLGGEGRRVVEESGGGVVATPGDPRSIADAVLRLKRRSAAERAAMGRSGRAYVVNHYQRDVLADRYLEILSAAAVRAPASAPSQPVDVHARS
jgi:colanic acid biosynthesis glycosyl transferase WcaI